MDNWEQRGFTGTWEQIANTFGRLQRQQDEGGTKWPPGFVLLGHQA
jgi:hypothetical protein